MTAVLFLSFIGAIVLMTFGCFFIYTKPMLYRVTYTMGVVCMCVFLVGTCTW